MVAYGEGKKCHNPSGDNQELSFEASDHRFGYGRTPRNGHPSTSRSKENVAFVRDMFIRVNQHVRLLAKVDCRGTRYVRC